MPYSIELTKSLLQQHFYQNMLRAGPFEKDPVIALAVSGGADSMALLHCAKIWALQYQALLSVVTVNHGLRPEAVEEVKKVALSAEKLGIPCKILNLPTKLTGHNLSAQARTWRYQLMIDWCRQNHILHLLTAHQQDDQVETFFNRLERGSGLEGLCAMPLVRGVNQVRLIRPFLGANRTQIKQFLADHQLDWVEDPTNQDDRYFRARFRKILPDLISQQLLKPARVELAIHHLQQANQVIEQQIADIAACAIVISPLGYVEIDCNQFRPVLPEIALRVLNRCLMIVSGRNYGLRYERLLTLYHRIKTQSFLGATLGGCMVSQREGKLMIQRERGVILPEISLSGLPQLWDERFFISFSSTLKSVENYKVKEFGGGRKKLTDWINQNDIVSPKAVQQVLHNLPPQIFPTLPALWNEEELLAIPPLLLQQPGIDLTHLQCHFYPKQALTWINP